MFNAQGELDIFESFVVDTDLPKHRRARDRAAAAADLGKPYLSPQSVTFGASTPGWIQIQTIGTNAATTWVQAGGQQQLAAQAASSTPTLWARFKRAFRRNKQARPPPPSELTLEEFFLQIKTQAIEEVDGSAIVDRAQGYKALLEQASKAGQTALVERLAAGLIVTKLETSLLALGRTKYVEEARIVECVKKAPKGLRLDWIKNFVQPIPRDILDRKAACDEDECFDNYAVLHFDPEKKSWAETAAEKERRKDPILFGLIQGSRRCYVVGDWVNEYCDLTLDKMAEILGARPDSEIPKELTAEYVAGPAESKR